MAFASTTEWDIRSTGSDANGGGWDTSSSGSDFSQQDSPQVTYTDLVIDGSVNTKCTSAGTPFTSAHVGNIINITSGTGFTVQRVQVVSVASAVATCDKSLGTLSSTGGNGKLGGGMLSIDTAFAAAQSSSTTTTFLHLKSATYTRTTTLTLTPTVGGAFAIIGYGTSHNDGGTAPLITSATNSLRVVSCALGTSNLLFENVSFSHTAGTRGVLVGASSNNSMMMFDRCVFDGGTYAVIGDNSVASAGNIILSQCEVKNCTTGGIVSWFSMAVFDSYLHDNTGSAIKKVSNQDDHFLVSGSIITGNTKGIEANGYAPGGGGNSGNTLGLSILRCTIASNTSDGINFASNNTSVRQIQIENNIIYNNGGYGINAATNWKTSSFLNKNNAFGSNTSGNANNWTTGVNPVTLTADPFTSAAGGDYSLNHTVGGGASCRTAGYAGVFPGGNSTGFLDIGAVQTSGGAGSGGILVHPGTGGGMRG